MGRDNPEEQLLLGALAADRPDRYLFRGEQGRGGQAKVLVAFDQTVGREIAWKELLESRRSGEDDGQGGDRTRAALIRFLREARITGQLEHPNIVPVYELGTNDQGDPYYTMRLVNGETLGARLKACDGLDARMKLLGSVGDVSDGIAFAHSRGVIHRDIKPDNVVVGEFGETVILDWGLAKAQGREDAFAGELEQRAEALRRAVDSSQTLDGTALGTPAYMSPEQARGTIDEIDERSDVWGLGAVLYEVLTGQPPVTGETVYQIIGRVANQRVAPVAELCPEAPAELAAVAEKALAREKADRYQSAREVAEEIHSYMTGRRVGAYVYSSWELLDRFARRNKALVISAAIFLLLILVSLVALWSALREESAALEREQTALVDVRKGRIQASYHLSQAYAREAARLSEAGRFLAARIFASGSLLTNPANPRAELYSSGFSEANPEAHRLWVRAASLASGQARGLDAEILVAHRLPGGIGEIALSASPPRLFAVGRRGTVAAWPLGPGRPATATQAHDGPASGVAVDPGGRFVVTGGVDGTARVWDIEGRRVERVVRLPAGVRYLTLSADGERLAMSGSDNAAYLIALDSGKILGKWSGFRDEVREVAVSPDGASVAAASWDKTVRIFPVHGGPARILSGHEQAVEQVTFSHDGAYLVSAGFDGRLRVWDPGSGEPLAELAGDPDTTHSIAPFAHQPLVASGGQDRSAKVWDLPSGDLLLSLDGPGAMISAVEVSPDGRFLAAVFEPDQVVVWRLHRRAGSRRVSNPDWMYGLAVAPSSEFLATSSWDGRLRLLRRSDYGIQAETRLDGPVMSVALHPSEPKVAAGLRSGKVVLWDTASGKVLEQAEGHDRNVPALTFDATGRSVLSVSLDGTLRQWDLVSGSARVLARQEGRFNGVALASGGRIAAGGRDGLLRLVDPATGQTTAELRTHDSMITDVAATAAGKHVATCDQAGLVLVWDAGGGEPLAQLQLPSQFECLIDFSPDGRLIAAGLDDGVIHVWDWRAGRLLAQHDVGNKIERLRFDPEGGRLLAVHKQHLTMVPLNTDALDADPRTLLAESERRAGLKLDGIELAFDEESVAAPVALSEGPSTDGRGREADR